ncbi:hypothetical protein HNQ99_002283 [Rhizorhapis suberifaciens]|uniref:Uncharacterized protein n=1 Tax=Rhizorhapis suberifaciens TaxID=13656 RepID=A0A840HV85_9SPHN|nr:hypothetical protein [Rhizorhapis suberifaciens]
MKWNSSARAERRKAKLVAGGWANNPLTCRILSNAGFSITPDLPNGTEGSCGTSDPDDVLPNSKTKPPM